MKDKIKGLLLCAGLVFMILILVALCLGSVLILVPGMPQGLKFLNDSILSSPMFKSLSFIVCVCFGYAAVNVFISGVRGFLEYWVG